jgi:hypothetical protein
MASRNRIHKSPISRKRGPTQPHKTEAPKEGRASDSAAERKARRNAVADKQPWDLDTEKGYGGGKKTKKSGGRQKWGEEAGVNTRFMQTGMEDDYTDPRPHNNYDDSDKTYPPAHRW